MPSSPTNLAPLKKLVLEFFEHDSVKIVLFGSRARDDATSQSDVDIGIIPQNRLPAIRISRLLDEIERSTIPFKVEIVNLSETSEVFRNEAMKEVVVWKE